MPSTIECQGHRGARGLCPENTLPSIELALDLGVASVEVDLHLTIDNVPVLSHDPNITERLCRLIEGRSAPQPREQRPVRSLTLEQLRCYRADRNPNPIAFPGQQTEVAPLMRALAADWRIDPFTIPALADLFAFVDAYQGEPGRAAGKTDDQRQRARRLRFDLELKRVPFRAELIGDSFDGTNPGVLECSVVEAIHTASMEERTTVRSFDHRSVRAIRRLEPRLTTAVIVAGTAPLHPPEIARAAGAQVYCPDFEFLDEAQVRECRAAGIRVLPWTVNAIDDMQCLLDWRVDGMTTDHPDRLMELLG
jgi:glycerophosphoryl diester phosphodiesterase